MAETPTTPTPTIETPTGPVAVPSGADVLYAAEPTPAAEAPAPVEPAPVAEEPPASLITPPAQAEGEAKPEAEAAKEGDAPAEDAAPAPLTAESYTFKLPEGFEVDDALTAKAKTTFAVSGIPPAAAQPLIDLMAETLQAQVASFSSAAAAQDAAWRTELYALPEFTGPTRRTSETTIQRFIDEHGGDEFRTVIHNAGLGNNPTLAKALLKAATALTEGGPTPSGLPTPQGQNGRPAKGATPGQILYESDGPGSRQTQQ